MIRVTQERSFAGMGWWTKPAIVVARNYTGPSTQRQAHDWYEYTGDTSTQRERHAEKYRERKREGGGNITGGVNGGVAGVAL